MNNAGEQPAIAEDMSGFDAITCLTSVASLLASTGAGAIIVPSIHGGFYGGTALMVFVVLSFQVAALFLAVALPSLVLAVRHRLRLSRTAGWLLAIAVAGVAVEGLALWLIPVTGRC